MIGSDITNGDDLFKVAMHDADCSVGKNFCDLIGAFSWRRQLASLLEFFQRMS